MAYSDYPESGVSSGPASDYTEYPTGDAGGPPGEEPEEHFVGDDGYMNPKVQLVRRIKGVILGVELLVMAVLIYMAYDSSMAGYQSLSSKPILPLEPILFMALFMAVMMAITGIVFRLLELRFTENPSQRVLLANSAFRSALTSMVVAIVLLVILLYVPTTSVMKDAMITKADETKGYGDFSYKFKSQDEFLVTWVKSVKITTNLPEDMVICGKDVYGNFSVEYQQYLDGEHTKSYLENYTRENKIVLLQNTTQLVHENSDPNALQYGEYQAAVFVGTEESANIHYEIQREIQPGLLNTLIVFLLVFAIMDGVWMVAALLIKQKFKKGSIYT
jgi:hypothetical protein